MTRIEIAEDHEYIHKAVLTRGSRQAQVWRRDCRWYFEQHSTNAEFYVGCWMSWRLERARRRAVLRGYWIKVPQARLISG